MALLCQHRHKLKSFALNRNFLISSPDVSPVLTDNLLVEASDQYYLYYTEYYLLISSTAYLVSLCPPVLQGYYEG